MKTIKHLLILTLLFQSIRSIASEINISSLKELATYGSKNGNTITMTPGIYHLKDFISVEGMKEKHQNKEFYFMKFDGSNNEFRLEGVEIIVDTKLRTALNPPIHTNEFLITGTQNIFNGLTIKYKGNGTSPGGAAVEVSGDGNTLKNITMHVTGSKPYGYGDLFGKGKKFIIKHQKHSGLLVTGNDTNLYDCKLYMRSFGHGYFVQKDVSNIHFENCYVEGEVRNTNDILAEKEGAPLEANYKTWTKNHEGNFDILPNYTKALCEDGFRTYGQIKNISFKNCTAKNTRAGFELRTDGGITIENCTTIGTERGYWVGNDAVVKNSKGDVSHGPLMFIEGSNVKAELFLVPTESTSVVNAIGTIEGINNQVTLKLFQNQKTTSSLPILVGYKAPQNGEGMAPYGKRETTDLILVNETKLPIKIDAGVSNSKIIKNGKVIENNGENVNISKK